MQRHIHVLSLAIACTYAAVMTFGISRANQVDSQEDYVRCVFVIAVGVICALVAIATKPDTRP